MKEHKNSKSPTTSPPQSNNAKAQSPPVVSFDPLTSANILHLQRRIGNKATLSLIKNAPQDRSHTVIQPKLTNVIQRGPEDDDESLLGDQSDANHSGQFEMLGFEPDPEEDAPQEAEIDLDQMYSDDSDVQVSDAELETIDRGKQLSIIVDLLREIMDLAAELDQKMSAYIVKKADFDLLGGFQEISQLMVDKVERNDVKTLKDLSAMLNNPFSVTRKDVFATEVALRTASAKMVALSKGAAEAEHGLKEKSMRSNIKKMKGVLDPKADLAAKIASKFNGVTASIVGSIVTFVASPIITPPAAIGVGYSVKKAMEKGGESAIKWGQDKKVVDEQMAMDDADEFQPLLGNADIKKSKLRSVYDKTKAHGKNLTTKQGLGQRLKKEAFKGVVKGAVDVASTVAGPGGAALSGAVNFGVSEAADKLYGKTEVDSDNIAYQLNFNDVEAFGQKLDEFLTAVANL